MSKKIKIWMISWDSLEMNWEKSRQGYEAKSIVDYERVGELAKTQRRLLPLKAFHIIESIDYIRRV